MKTRTAKPGTPFRQERYCSSPEFERGLSANLVAMRCRTLDKANHRELVWFLQWLSHQTGGLEKMVSEMLELWPERFRSPSMQARKGKSSYRQEEIEAIVDEMADSIFPRNLECEGEFATRLARANAVDEARKGIAAFFEPARENDVRRGAYNHGTVRQLWDDLTAGPIPVETVWKLCRSAARGEIIGFEGLADHIFKRVCLDPAFAPENWLPWYLPDLIAALDDYKCRYQAKIEAGAVSTELGKRVADALDYSLECRGLVLIEGLERRGKTHAAKAWCAARPGKARYISVPSTSDDIGFFRAIAHGLGISAGNAAKAVELRDKIQETIQSGDLACIFDNAHFLFPQTCRVALPRRITWVLTSFVDEGVPVALVTTPQFTVAQQMTSEKSRWRDGQLTGRIMHFERLPQEISDDDLRRVALTYLPEADEKSLKLLTNYAAASDKYLQAIEALAKRGFHIARRDDRSHPTYADLKTALEAGVIPSDTAMVSAVETAKDRLHGRRRRSRLETSPTVVAAPISTTESSSRLRHDHQIVRWPSRFSTAKEDVVA